MGLVMKNKKVIVVVIATLALVLVGGVTYFKLMPRSVKNVDSPDNTGLFSSVRDALSKKLTLSCEFKDENGALIRSYVKNGLVRVTSTTPLSGEQSPDSSQAGDFILKDNKMYIWDSKTKQGFVYEVKDQGGENLDQTAMAQNEPVRVDSYINMLDKYKDSCKVTTLDDSYFNLPTDVTFQDMNKLFEDLSKQMPQTPQE